MCQVQQLRKKVTGRMFELNHQRLREKEIAEEEEEGGL